MNYTEILDALREFTSRERIEFLPLEPDARPVSDYVPIQKYVLDLKHVVKPETAAEDLFTALYRRIDQACAWVQKILKPENGEMYLAEMPPNVEAAIAFRRRHCFDNKRELAAAVAERHVCCQISDSIARNVMTLRLCREIIPMCGDELNFRDLTGTTRAFPNIKRILGKVDSGQARCGSRFSSEAGLRRVVARRNH